MQAGLFHENPFRGVFVKALQVGESTPEMKAAERDSFAVDVRPDLTEDAERWRIVLQRAAKTSDELFGLLRGYRACGARLAAIPEGFRLLPPEEFGAETGWRNREDWQADREHHLVPVGSELSKILAREWKI